MNSTVCPFCQRDNCCTANSNACWCKIINVPSALIELLPTNAINKQCICQTCIESYQKDAIAFKEGLNGKTQ